MDRQFNFKEFISQTVENIKTESHRRDSLPVIGVDEGLNNKRYIDPMLRRLVACNIVSLATPLWYQRREKKDGKLLTVLGSGVSKSGAVQDFGRPIRRNSWPDENVVALLVAYFDSTDKVCLLTQNTRNDRDGLRYILENEIAPAIESAQYNHLGLLVLAQKPGTTVEDYCRAVERRLFSVAISSGFAWETMP